MSPASIACANRSLISCQSSGGALLFDKHAASVLQLHGRLSAETATKAKHRKAKRHGAGDIESFSICNTHGPGHKAAQPPNGTKKSRRDRIPKEFDHVGL